MQLAADSLSRLHVENLFLPKTTEELDEDVIRMMERGEGEDDIPMFGEDYTHEASTQTDPLGDIRSHNTYCSSCLLPNSQERAF